LPQSVGKTIPSDEARGGLKGRHMATKELGLRVDRRAGGREDNSSGDG
jgi:hypothetical protein